MNFPRITIDPAIRTGKPPCIRGLRFPFARLLGLLASGESREHILPSYGLNAEEIEPSILVVEPDRIRRRRLPIG